METATLETVIDRLDRLEKMVVDMAQQLALIATQLDPQPTDNHKPDTQRQEFSMESDKRDAHIAKKILTEIYEKMGIPPDFELRPLEELRESMRQNGIRAEDNEFSRAIIEEREK